MATLFNRNPEFYTLPSEVAVANSLSGKTITVNLCPYSAKIYYEGESGCTLRGAVLLAHEDNVRHKASVILDSKTPNIEWMRHLANLYFVLFTRRATPRNLTTAVSLSSCDGGAMLQTRGGLFLFVAKSSQEESKLNELINNGDGWERIESDLLFEARRVKLEMDSLLKNGVVIKDRSSTGMDNKLYSGCLSILDGLSKRETN